jgi:hypothetical protein
MEKYLFGHKIHLFQNKILYKKKEITKRLVANYLFLLNFAYSLKSKPF